MAIKYSTSIYSDPPEGGGISELQGTLAGDIDGQGTFSLKNIRKPADDTDVTRRVDVFFQNPTFYYVDATTGNDSNDGSLSHPWKTLTKAVDEIKKIANNSVTIYANGTFNEDVNLYSLPQMSGITGVNIKRGNQITIQGNPSCVINGHGIVIANCPSIKLKDITVQNFTGKTGLSCYHSGVEVDNVTVSGCYCGIWVEGGSLRIIDKVNISSNTIGIYAERGAQVVGIADVIISGNTYNLYSSRSAHIQLYDKGNGTGNFNFTNGRIYATRGSFIMLYGNNNSSGVKCLISGNVYAYTNSNVYLNGANFNNNTLTISAYMNSSIDITTAPDNAGSVSIVLDNTSRGNFNQGGTFGSIEVYDNCNLWSSPFYTLTCRTLILDGCASMSGRITINDATISGGSILILRGATNTVNRLHVYGSVIESNSAITINDYLETNNSKLEGNGNTWTINLGSPTITWPAVIANSDVNSVSFELTDWKEGGKGLLGRNSRFIFCQLYADGTDGNTPKWVTGFGNCTGEWLDITLENIPSLAMFIENGQHIFGAEVNIDSCSTGIYADGNAYVKFEEVSYITNCTTGIIMKDKATLVGNSNIIYDGTTTPISIADGSQVYIKD